MLIDLPGPNYRDSSLAKTSPKEVFGSLFLNLYSLKEKMGRLIAGSREREDFVYIFLFIVHKLQQGCL